MALKIPAAVRAAREKSILRGTLQLLGGGRQTMGGEKAQRCRRPVSSVAAEEQGLGVDCWRDITSSTTAVLICEVPNILDLTVQVLFDSSGRIVQFASAALCFHYPLSPPVAGSATADRSSPRSANSRRNRQQAKQSY